MAKIYEHAYEFLSHPLNTPDVILIAELFLVILYELFVVTLLLRKKYFCRRRDGGSSGCVFDT